MVMLGVMKEKAFTDGIFTFTRSSRFGIFMVFILVEELLFIMVEIGDFMLGSLRYCFFFPIIFFLLRFWVCFHVAVCLWTIWFLYVLLEFLHLGHNDGAKGVST